MSLPIAGATSLWIGWRYLAIRGRAFVSLITWVSVLGLGLGVAVLVVVISVMNGFDEELHRRILGTVPHVVLVPPTTTMPLTCSAIRAGGRRVSFLRSGRNGCAQQRRGGGGGLRHRRTRHCRDGRRSRRR